MSPLTGCPFSVTWTWPALSVVGSEVHRPSWRSGKAEVLASVAVRRLTGFGLGFGLGLDLCLGAAAVFVLEVVVLVVRFAVVVVVVVVVTTVVVTAWVLVVAPPEPDVPPLCRP